MILLTGGLAFLVFAPWIALAVVVVLAVVVISYRQLIKAYPSGGGDYEVASKNLGEIPGVVVASALLVDYVLTVAVSVASGVDNIISAVPVLNGGRVELAVGFVIVIIIVNLRGVREASLVFALPTYIFIGSVAFMIIVGLGRTALGDPPIASSAAICGAGTVAHAGRVHPARPPRVLERLFGADGRRGRRQRRAGVPQAEGPQRPGDARAHGHDRRPAVLGTHRARAVLRGALLRRPVQPPGLRLPEHAAAESHGAGGRGHLRGRVDPVLRHPGGDRVRPAPRGEHGVQRVPAARVGAGARRIRPEGTEHPRRPARVLERHDHPRPRRDPHPDHLPGQPHDADPALHHRRVRLVLAGPDRHGAALAPDAPGSRESRGSRPQRHRHRGMDLAQHPAAGRPLRGRVTDHSGLHADLAADDQARAQRRQGGSR